LEQASLRKKIKRDEQMSILSPLVAIWNAEPGDAFTYALRIAMLISFLWISDKVVFDANVG